MNPTSIFKEYIGPAFQKAFHWAAEHPRYIALILLIWSFVPFIPCQVIYALFIQLPGQVIAEILACAGYTPDRGVRPGSLVSFFGGERAAGVGPSDDLLPRLRSRLRPYGAVIDARLEEGEGCVTDDEEEEENGYCQGNAIECTRLLLKTLLFVSSVVVFVGSLKEGDP